MPLSPFVEHFGSMPDPRVDRTKKHFLLDILLIALLAVICGAEGWEDMETFGRAKERFLRERLRLPLPHGIPSHDTFRRLFARLDPDAFGRAFTAWTQTLRLTAAGELLALDGKTLRHSFDTAAGQAPIHLVTAWAASNRLVLGQIQVDDKSNEIPAFPALLSLLDLEGCTVTIDAMGCQREIARQIVEQGGDYVLAVKENQPTLLENIRLFFDDVRANGAGAIRCSQYRKVEKDHGRIEIRHYWQVDEIDWLEGKEKWAGLCSIGMVASQRRIGEKETVEERYFISSLPRRGKRLAKAVRGHWGIENQEHYILDCAFREDACRIRRENAPANLATLRRMALNLLAGEPTSKRGVKARLRQAGWDDDYLLRVLAH
jgi:predicted transposase YbfD/YdcC